MLKAEVWSDSGRSVVIMDSITKVTAENTGQAIVSASHGGASSGEFALEHPGAVVMFNDAGCGKDDAGVAALDMLERAGVAAATIAHTSARIGDSRDHWDSGRISFMNAKARELGFQQGQAVSDALKQWAATGRVGS
uniref:Uncharacterized protein n=1 Tax=Streptomyces sp. NBC_00093 TaxID=2975649 RepID=A0AAU2AEG9_9ACTN